MVGLVTPTSRDLGRGSPEVRRKSCPPIGSRPVAGRCVVAGRGRTCRWEGRDGAAGIGRARWMPDQESLESWLKDLVEQADSKPADTPLHPAVEGFRDAHRTRPDRPMMYVTQMIEQVPHAKKYRRAAPRERRPDAPPDRRGHRPGPEYNETGLVGVPLNAVLDWCMGTPAGFAAFRHEPINAMFRKILRAWCDFLCGPDVALRAQRLAEGLEVRVGPEVDEDRAVPAQAPREALGLRVVERLLHPAVQAGPAADRRPRRRQGDHQRLRVDARTRSART